MNIQSTGISRFYGLDRLEKGRKGEFLEMAGLSSDKYPCLSPSKSSEKVFSAPGTVMAVIAPGEEDNMTGFTGVAGGCFYYNGEKIEFMTGDMSIPGDAKVTLVDFNGRILICAYGNGESRMYYYDHTASGDREHVLKMEKGVYGVKCTVSSSGDPASDYYVTNSLTADGVDWIKYFSPGDSICIKGFTEDDNVSFTNNTTIVESKYQTSSAKRIQSCIVERVTSSRLYVRLYNYLSESLVFKSETAQNADIYIDIPTINHICVHNNRVWGTNPNGEFVYASKLGDCFNWHSYQGLANDSFYAEIGTAGGFTGIVSYRDNLVAFKKDHIHHIYGDKPSNFSIPKQLSGCGCIDIRSAMQLGTSLFFLGYNGFYVYSGGQPELISQKLDRKYMSASAMTDGEKYIVSCVGTDGVKEFLVYDTRYDMWHKEEYISITGAFRRGGRLYFGGEKEVLCYGSGTPARWECETCVMYENVFDNKGIIELWIRAKVEDGASVNVYTSEEDGDWIFHGTLSPAGLKVYRLPVRFVNGEFYRIRIEGKGNAIIYDMEWKRSQSGRKYKN